MNRPARRVTVPPDADVVWANGWLPVVHGSRPAEVLTLADLADPERFTAALTIATTFTETRRKAAITLVHYALVTLDVAVLAPLVRHGFEVAADADQIGMVMDAGLDFESIWVGPATLSVGSATAPRQVGARLRRLLEPVMATACRLGPVGARGLEVIVLESLTGAGRRLDPSVGPTETPQWLAELIVGLGLQARLPERSMAVVADDGPRVMLSVPRVCCVMAPTPSCHACPTCPKMPDEERLAVATTFLADLSDAEFAEEIGRPRIGRARRP